MPRLDNEIESWFYHLYHSLKNLSGFEYQITITDFKHYFDIYPIAFPRYLVISIIKQIERKAQKYQKQKDEAKAKNKK